MQDACKERFANYLTSRRNLVNLIPPSYSSKPPGKLQWYTRASHLVYSSGILEPATWYTPVVNWSQQPGILQWYTGASHLVYSSGILQPATWYTTVVYLIEPATWYTPVVYLIEPATWYTPVVYWSKPLGISLASCNANLEGCTTANVCQKVICWACQQSIMGLTAC